MSTNHKKCLLLNCDYTPISVIGWQKAIIWNIKHSNNINYGIQILELYNDCILCANGTKINIPAVAKTKHFHKYYQYRSGLKLSRHNVFTRDNYSCQYCGKYLHQNQLTYDHVIPKSRFADTKKASTWNNIVTACYKCNFKKANKTPNEAGMRLLNQPSMPKFSIEYLPWYKEHFIIEDDVQKIWNRYIGHLANNYG